MKNFELLNDYLSGKKFDNGLLIKWDVNDHELISRIDYLSDFAKVKISSI